MSGDNQPVCESCRLLLTPSSAFNHCMALHALLCVDVPLRIYTLTL